MKRPAPRRSTPPLLAALLSLGIGALPSLAQAAPKARGVVMLKPAPVTPQPAVQSRVLFLNRAGGTYTPGFDDDARTNVTGLVDSPSVISPFKHGDATWQAVVECMRDTFAPFDLTITTEDPGNQPHMEAVIAGYPTEIGETDGVAGIALMTDDCSIIEGAITLTFANVMTDANEICWTAAQEAAHSMGLDHSIDCADPMTYDESCGLSKRFQDRDGQCGEYSPRACSCGGATQNAVQVLLSVLGPSSGGPNPDPDGSGNGNGDGTGNGDGSGNGGNDGGSDVSTGQVTSSCSVGNSQQGGLTGLLCIAGLCLGLRRRKSKAIGTSQPVARSEACQV